MSSPRHIFVAQMSSRWFTCEQPDNRCEQKIPCLKSDDTLGRTCRDGHSHGHGETRASGGESGLVSKIEACRALLPPPHHIVDTGARVKPTQRRRRILERALVLDYQQCRISRSHHRWYRNSNQNCTFRSKVLFWLKKVKKKDFRSIRKSHLFRRFRHRKPKPKRFSTKVANSARKAFSTLDVLLDSQRNRLQQARLIVNPAYLPWGTQSSVKDLHLIPQEEPLAPNAITNVLLGK
ncbi:hypothetical protein BDV93DRAFT_514349 [Ceratobasidium sp. AG-I]|nr:hypothetical protein BDV93DRAFT_514349 [Ceratobasidium sp. AG-I]